MRDPMRDPMVDPTIGLYVNTMGRPGRGGPGVSVA
jgi:hypothetical protein